MAGREVFRQKENTVLDYSTGKEKAPESKPSAFSAIFAEQDALQKMLLARADRQEEQKEESQFSQSNTSITKQQKLNLFKSGPNDLFSSQDPNKQLQPREN